MENERINYVASYGHEIDYALADGEGPILRKVRERISTQSLTPADEFAMDILDEEVIASVIELDEIADYLLSDDETQPLSHWWWHLGKIRAESYPTDLLPPHLRVIYTGTASDKKVA